MTTNRPSRRNKALTRLQELGIPLITVNFDISPVLQYDEERIRSLSLQVIDEHMMMLTTYLIHVQQQLNLAKIDAHEAEDVFEKTLNDNMESASGKTKDERRKNAEYLPEVESDRDAWKDAEAFVQMLDDIPKALTEKLNAYKKVHDELNTEKKTLRY